MSYYADPDSFGACSLRTDEQLRRDAAVLSLFPAAPVADRLLRRAVSSPANGSEETRLTAGDRGTATAPGLASMVGSES